MKEKNPKYSNTKKRTRTSFLNTTKDILFQKCYEPRQTVQLQRNNHFHIKNEKKEERDNSFVFS